MALSASKSYALVFCLTFVLVAALTIVTAKLFDKTPTVPLAMRGASGAPPFPDAYPQLPPPVADPAGPKCINLCIHPATGKLLPCPTTALTTCDNDNDCSVCAKKQPMLDLKCLPASAWPTVAKDQANLKNTAPKYCLPARKECAKLPDANPLLSCQTNDDCVQCVDELPNSEAWTCQLKAGGETVDLISRQVTAPQPGRYCAPDAKGCDPRYGTATWTDRGWTCACKYPDLFGGPQCNTLIACSNDETTQWSQDKQQLLLNIRGLDGSEVGTPWSWDTEIDPGKCVGLDGKQVECQPGLPPTVACQCDGLQKKTHGSFTYMPGKPHECKLDPCGTLDGIGKTWLWEGAPPKMNNLPPTTCSCSGFGSSSWSRTTAPNAPNEGFTWKGYCKDYSIPGTSIVIPASGAKECETEPRANNNSEATFLIPGKNVEGESICTKDPCLGQYADLAYRTNQGTAFGTMGHFDATQGKCVCTESLGAREVPVIDCDPRVNPTCATCANACLGDIDELCPLHESVGADGKALKDPCNRKCVTSIGGYKTCLFSDNCFSYGGRIYVKRGSHECCEGLRDVPDACELAHKGERCQQVKSEKYKSCNTNNNEYYSTAFICTKDKRCGPTACHTLHTPGLDPCGGKGQSEFKDGCGITRNYPK